jgi:hypothetical protein
MRAVLVLVALLCVLPYAAAQDAPRTIYDMDNLVAWCVVPFDANARGPKERAEMLSALGFTKLAYDWRDVHVPTFEEEIVALKEKGIEFFAFWSQHEAMFKLFEQYSLKPQIWVSLSNPGPGSQEDKVAAAGRSLLPVLDRILALDCTMGLYNHGGWGGEPENMVAVCEWLRKERNTEKVGIVYNFHHGHEHIEKFEEHFTAMQAYLMCVNINGMNDGANPKILPVGRGTRELAMMKIVQDAGYLGPIGILDHRSELDAELSLRENLEGLETLRPKLSE